VSPQFTLWVQVCIGIDMYPSWRSMWIPLAPLVFKAQGQQWRPDTGYCCSKQFSHLGGQVRCQGGA
jgi:hypothetical protein